MKQQTKRRISAMISVATSAVLFTSVPAFAQTVADAARRERERKKTAALHVYTNEDLAKPQILVPDDQARVARKGGTERIEATTAPVPLPASPQLPAPTGSSALHASVSTIKASRPLNSTSRKDVAARIIASTPNVQIIDSFTGMSIASLAMTRTLAFPASASDATPLLTPKGQVPLPVVNLPVPAVDAYPLPSATSVVSFPESAVIGAASRGSTPQAKTVVAPTIDNAFPSFNTTHIGILREDVAPARFAQPATAPLANQPAPKGRAIPVPEAPVVPALPPPVQLFIGTATVNAISPAPRSRPVLRERVNLLTEPPAIPVLSPVQSSIRRMIDDASPVPIAPPVEKSVHLPASASQDFAGATITVQRGDSLWKLAERYLGKAERWVEIAKNNPQLENPGLIRPGDPIHLPLPVELRAEVKKIILRRGDTLWSVAQAEFGQPLAFACIARANPQLQSANVIRAGQTLLLPQACPVSR